MKIPSAAERTDSIISRSTGTDLVDETLTESKVQHMHDKVKCRNNEVVHHLPLPPTFSRFEVRTGFIGSFRCVNSMQHLFRVFMRNQRLFWG